MELLIENGAEVDAKNIHDDTPFHVASEKKNMSIMKFLINKGAESTEED